MRYCHPRWIEFSRRRKTRIRRKGASKTSFSVASIIFFRWASYYIRKRLLTTDKKERGVLNHRAECCAVFSWLGLRYWPGRAIAPRYRLTSYRTGRVMWRLTKSPRTPYHCSRAMPPSATCPTPATWPDRTPVTTQTRLPQQLLTLLLRVVASPKASPGRCILSPSAFLWSPVAWALWPRLVRHIIFTGHPRLRTLYPSANRHRPPPLRIGAHCKHPIQLKRCTDPPLVNPTRHQQTSCRPIQ